MCYNQYVKQPDEPLAYTCFLFFFFFVEGFKKMVKCKKQKQKPQKFGSLTSVVEYPTPHPKRFSFLEIGWIPFKFLFFVLFLFFSPLK